MRPDHWKLGLDYHQRRSVEDDERLTAAAFVASLLPSDSWTERLAELIADVRESTWHDANPPTWENPERIDHSRGVMTVRDVPPTKR